MLCYHIRWWNKVVYIVCIRIFFNRSHYAEEIFWCLFVSSNFSSRKENSVIIFWEILWLMSFLECFCSKNCKRFITLQSRPEFLGAPCGWRYGITARTLYGTLMLLLMVTTRSALVNCQSHATFLFMTIEYTAAPMNVTNRIPQPWLYFSAMHIHKMNMHRAQLAALMSVTTMQCDVTATRDW